MAQISYGLPLIIAYMFRAYEILIFVYCILTFFPRIFNSQLGAIIRMPVEPFLNLISRIIPTRIGFIDISPFIALVLIQIIGSVIFRLI